MLAADFSHVLPRYVRAGEFGVPELDAFTAPLVASLLSTGVRQGERAFCMALSFHVKQLTEWDLLAVTDYQPDVHGVALAHQCELRGAPSERQLLVAFRKPPVTAGRIALQSTPMEAQGWTRLRAPAIRFLASVDPADAGTLPAELASGAREGQQGAALLLVDGDSANELAKGVETAAEAFNVRYWLEVQEPGDALRILTLITAGIAAHEV